MSTRDFVCSTVWSYEAAISMPPKDVQHPKLAESRIMSIWLLRVGWVYLCHLPSIDPLCPGQQNEGGRGQHRPSLHRTQAQIGWLRVAHHFRKKPITVIMSYIPIAQIPSPVSQTQTGDHSTLFLLFYVVRY